MREMTLTNDQASNLTAMKDSDISDRERLDIGRELELRLSDFWYDVDANFGRKAAEFYTEDGVFEASNQTYRGREIIDQFYAHRRAQGPRVAAHTVTNFRALVQSPTRATTTWYLILYAHDGAPVLPSEPPIQIAVATDTCVKDTDGLWRYAHRKFETWFKGGVPTSRMEIPASR